MKTIALKFISCVFAFIVITAGILPMASGQSAECAQEVIDGILHLKLQEASVQTVQEWIDGELSLTAGDSAEWYVFALRQYGSYDFSGYEKALLEYLSSNEVNSASSRQKYALVLAATGSDSRYITDTLKNSIGEQGIMSFIFGLHLLNNGYESAQYSSESVKEELLDRQLDDGAWAVTGNIGDCDVTAMAVQALAPHYSKNSAVKEAVNKALEWLSVRQNDSGDYSSYGISNPESTAQVITALASLGIDGCSDSRFIKNGNTLFDGIMQYRLADGSFCHKLGEKSNGTATVQVFSAAVAYKMLMQGKGSFYILDRQPISPITTQTRFFSQAIPSSAEKSEQNTTAILSDNITSVNIKESLSESATKTVLETTLQQISKQEKDDLQKDNKPAVTVSVILAVALCAIVGTAIKTKKK